MKKFYCSAAIAGIVALNGVASAQNYEKGMLFSTQPANVLLLDFGLEPGVCVGPFTAPTERLVVTQGTFSYTYGDGRTAEYKPGDIWWHDAGTVAQQICNKGNVNAVMTGVQFTKPEQK